MTLAYSQSLEALILFLNVAFAFILGTLCGMWMKK